MRYLRLGIATLLLGGCSIYDGPDITEPEPPEPPAVTGSIIGLATIDGNAAPDLTITVTGPKTGSKVTSSAGRAVFTGLPAGTYKLVLSGFDTSRVAFQEQSKGVTLASGDTVSVVFVGATIVSPPPPPQQNVVIKGLVWLDKDRDGTYQMGTDNVLSGVRVTLTGTQDRSATTGADGRYEFLNLPTGSYKVEITNPNPAAYAFDATDAAVTVTIPKTVEVNFRAVTR